MNPSTPFPIDDSPTLSRLLSQSVASRVHAQDASLYDFDPAAAEVAAHFMGWTRLASEPPTPVADIQAFADEAIEGGIDSVILIGQGGSSQAPMTLTKYSRSEGDLVRYRTLDSDSPVRLRKILDGCDLETTLVVVASKSGSTLEPRLLLAAVRDAFAEALGEEAVADHLVAITDPGSNLERQAADEGWRAIFSGVPEVGGRFSALSVFGLVPAALSGLPIADLVQCAQEAEARCAADNPRNPALRLATFLFDNYQEGRNKICYFAPRRGRVLGLWIEQLIAESTGKNGQGMLPYLEVNPLFLAPDRYGRPAASDDRCLVVFKAEPAGSDEADDFATMLELADPALPTVTFEIGSATEVGGAFIVWEYATAMLGWLMEVCPFDQPDVASAKAAVLDILRDGAPAPTTCDRLDDAADPAEDASAFAEVTIGPALMDAAATPPFGPTLHSALRALAASIRPGDYFAINAFVPFDGTGRRQALESLRASAASRLGCVSCLEIGPRYLHSTGQLQKGGPDQGVFLIVSADETHDISLPEGSEAQSLGALAKAQATGDMVILASRDRRCVHVHLPNNAGALFALSAAFDKALDEVLGDRD